MGAENRPIAEKAADQTYVAFRGMKGFVSVMYLCNDAAREFYEPQRVGIEGTGGGCSCGHSARGEPLMAGSIKEPPVRRFLDVYEPKP